MVIEKTIYKILKIRTSTNKVSGSGPMLSYKTNKGILIYNCLHLLGRLNNSRMLN